MKLPFALKLALSAAVLAFSVSQSVSANDIAVKTNLLYDATTSINLGAEAAIAPKWSFDLSGNLNAWTFSDGGKRWKHWLVQPEARYWFCQPFTGHFIGSHLLGGQYNVGGLDFGNLTFLGTDFGKLKENRYQGWFAGVGFTYGYNWILSRHFNLEAEFGFGWAYTRFDRYPCAHCGTKQESNKAHNYVGPTKVALNLVYVF